MISFNEVPDGIQIPGSYIELNTRLAARGLPKSEAKVVLLGQKTAAGTATAEQLVQILSDSDAADLFGRGSMLHRMAAACLTANRYMASLYALPLVDLVAGVAAYGTLTVSLGATPTAGTLKIHIGDDTVDVILDGTETAYEIAGAIDQAIDEATDLPVTATVAVSPSPVVTATCRHKGVLGNLIDLDWEYDGDDVTVTIVAMAHGVGDPDPQDALDVIFGVDMDVIVCPWNDASSLGDLSDHLVARSDGVEQRGAVGVSALDDTVSNATAITVALNDSRISVAVLEGTATWAPEIAAAYAAAIAGEPDLARPLNGVDLEGVAPPLGSTRYTRAELTTLLANGVTPLVVNANEAVEICRSITTYMKDDSGQADATLLDLQTIRVLDFVRKSCKQRFFDRFSQVKIANVAHTENTTDPTKIKVEIMDVLLALQTIDYLENVEDNADDIIVERNASDPTRADCRIPSDVVNGLHVLAARIDLIL